MVYRFYCMTLFHSQTRRHVIKCFFLWYARYRFRCDGSCASSYLKMYCPYFTYICPGAEPNGYFYGTHRGGLEAMAHLSLLLWICTVYNLTYICPCAESNGNFYGTHSMGSDATAHMSLLILVCTVYNLTYICLCAESNGYFYGMHRRV